MEQEIRCENELEELSPELQEKIKILQEEMNAVDGKEMILGLSNDTLVTLNPDNFTHLLIAGETGSGKSVLMNRLITEAFKHSDYMALFDLKRVELGRYKYIADTYTNIEAMSDAMDRIHEWMMKRFEKMDERGITIWDGGHSYIFIDEYADITTHENKYLAKNIQNKVASIARLGRAAKIHLVIATQYPTKEVVTMQLKMNCQKICLKCNADIGYRVMLDRKYIDLEGNGDALYQDKQGNIIHLQVLNCTNEYVNEYISGVEKLMKDANYPDYLERLERYNQKIVQAEQNKKSGLMDIIKNLTLK